MNPRTGKPISKATINRGLAVLSHMFTFALKKRLIASTSDDAIRTFT